MEPEVLHVSEADALRDMATILRRVQSGAEVVIERDARPVAIVRPPERGCRTTSESLALARAHEAESGQSPVLDADFAADVEEIVRNRRPWNPLPWD
jgi:antitoxin (DNA-binding transcriptional repressor) of toxin-antitoxin stability system